MGGYPPQGTVAITAEMVWTYPTRELTQPLLGFEEHAVGTLTADGTEQDVVELTELGTLEGWIDLSNMQAGDSVTIREYVRLKSGGTYRLYDSATYTGAQTKPALHVVKLPTRYGLKVTLEQTAGVNRDYDYNFFRRVLA